MRPYSAVQAIYTKDRNGRFYVLGSCFRLWSNNHYITASHCVDDIKCADLRILNARSDGDDIKCINITMHPESDISIIEVEDDVPIEFDKFNIFDKDFYLGTQIHCFGVVSELLESRQRNPFRLIGGIIQRDFIYTDKKYNSQALELSSPIPKGLSGGPAYIAKSQNITVGMCIATIQSEVVISNIYEYEENGKVEREKISEFVRYGVILRLYPLIDWISSIIGNTDS